jgi:hypothetical protein
MRRFLVPGVTWAVFLGAASAIGADDSPRAVIQRAVNATGGVDKATQPQAIYRKMKGTISLVDKSSLTAEYYTEKGGRQRLTMRWRQNGSDISVVTVSDGKHHWMRFNDQTLELDNQAEAQLKQSRHGDRVASLVPLLKDNSFKISFLPDSKVEGRPTLGIKIESKGQPEVHLFFDKASDLLVKAVHKKLFGGQGNEPRTLTILYQNYREEDGSPGRAEESILKEAKLAIDSASLLNYLRKQTLSAANQEDLKALVRHLGDPSFRVRQKASAALVARGASALPFLRQALRDADLEIASRAKKCFRQIRQGAGIPIVTSTIRLLGLRHPEGAAQALLDYYPCAPNETVAKEVQAALFGLASSRKNPDPVLVQALKSTDSERRAAAAAALGRDGAVYQKQPGRRCHIPGLKGASKFVYFQDGKKIMELETIEVQFFNKFDDRMFAKPE